jgi:lysophospholipase L1-like esterase
LTEYRAAVLQIGAEHKLPVVDLNAQLTSEPSWLSADGVHPSLVGHTLIAKLIAEKTAPLIAQRRP